MPGALHGPMVDGIRNEVEFCVVEVVTASSGAGPGLVRGYLAGAIDTKCDYKGNYLVFN